MNFWKQMRKGIVIAAIAFGATVGVVTGMTAPSDMTVAYAEEVTETASGTCGDNLTWVLTSDGTLTISGTGSMTDYKYYLEDCPWSRYREDITTVAIDSGVKSIGDDAFYDCSNLTSITIPDSVTSIREFAFCKCSSLTSITIPDSVMSIGELAFCGCSSLTSITIPDSVKSIGNDAFQSCSSLTTIKGYSGSYAETYAKANGYTFEAIGTIDSKEEGFCLGRDNNSFAHTSKSAEYSNAGFSGSTGYKLSDEYFRRLTGNSSASEISKIKKAMDRTWHGSCYGIAATMGLVYEGYLKISDLTDSKATSFYTLPYPCNDSKLLNTINYYQLSQHLRNGGWRSATVSRTYKSAWFKKVTNMKEVLYQDSLVTFLKKLVNNTKENHVTLLAFSTAEYGHAILVTGCTYDSDSKEYVITLYDENSVNLSNQKGGFCEMRIAQDYSSFSFTDACGTKVTKDNYLSLYFLDWDEIKKLQDGTTSTLTSNRVYFDLKLDKPFTIKDAKGKYLKYDGSKFSGDMTVYGIDTIAGASDGESRIVLETSASGTVTVTNITSGVDMEMYSKDQFLSLSGTNMKSAKLSFSDGIKIKGSKYTFDAYISTDDKINANENGLVRVTAEAAADVTITEKDGNVTTKSGKTLKNVKTKTYTGTKTKSKTYSSVSKPLTVKSVNVTLTTPTTKAVNVSNGIKVKWSKVKNASGYIVYRKVSGMKKWTRVKKITKNTTLSYVDKKAKSGKKYVYMVKAYKGSKVGSGKASSAVVRLSAVKKIKVKTNATGVKVTWTKSAGAKGYIVYRKTKGLKKWTRIATVKGAAKHAYLDKKAKSGKVYSYRVKAYNGKSYSAVKTSSAIRYLKAPAKVKAAKKSSGIKVTWTKTTGAKGYIVYRKAKGSKKWTRIATVKGAKKLAYLDKKAKKGKTYTYRVKAYYGNSYSAAKTSKAVKK